jgi:hypothetical protein
VDYGHWNVSAVGQFDPSQFFGFIYEIEELSTGRTYIGKKFFKFKRKKTKADPSRTKDSDWKIYCSSCEPLQKAIEEQGENKFAFRIIELCSGRCQLTYEENRVQFGRDVLRARLPNGERKYWNKTIGHLLFAGVEKQTEETKRKISEGLRGNTHGLGHSNGPRSEEVKAKIRDAQLGVPKPNSVVSEECLIAARQKNKLPWWHNGGQAVRSLEQPGPEWKPGSGKHHSRRLT